MSKKFVLYIIALVLVITIFIPATSGGLRYSINIDVSDVDASFIGRSSGDISGKSVAIVGDVNGDGYDDILIGAPEAGTQNAGRAYLIFGKKTGWSVDSSLSDCDITFTGDNWNRYAGHSVAGAGDFNGDGYDDILVGVPRFGGASTYGEAFLILGKPSGWSDSSLSSGSDIDFHGEHDGDVAGSSVAGAGDVNGDGFDDILIGAPTNDDGGSDSGKTYLIFGNSSGWDFDVPLSDANASFYGENASDKSGHTISGAGDVNGDGYDDILIGAPNNDDGGIDSGKSYLIFGNSSGWAKNINLSSAEASFIGGRPGDNSGYSVAGAGDVNIEKNNLALNKTLNKLS
ncbi:MAG: integrin alpha [Thermoplasmata archaeon]